MSDADQAGATTGRRRGGPVDPRLVGAVPVLRVVLVALGASSLAATVATVGQAFLVARIVTAVFVHPATAPVDGDLLALAGVMAAKAVAVAAGEWIAQAASTRVRTDLRRRLLTAVADLGPRWLAGADRPRLVAAAGPGIESLDGYVTRALPAAVAAVVTPVVVLAAIGVADWPSALILLATLPLVPVFLVLIGIATRRHMERQWASLARLSGQFLDLLEGLTTLKIYGRSRAQVRAVRDTTDRYRAETVATLRVAFLSGLVLDLLATLSVALVAVAVGLRLDHGGLTLGPDLTVLLLAPEVYAPLRAVGAQHHASEEARAVLDTTMGIVGLAPRRIPGPAPRPLLLAADADGTLLRFDHVDLTYPGRSQRAVADAQLAIPAVGLTTLTGPSGSGKSSILGLLLGRVAPSAGAILAGPEHAPIGADATGDAWKANLAWVPQRPRPTQPTVAAEVRLGDPTIDGAEVEVLLARCGAPPGRTPTGEDGTALSAGQRRRVALARAVARARSVRRSGGTPLVLLDEPTEDLDTETRMVVLDVIAELRTWASVVAATHDVALVALADAEIQVGDGRTTTSRTAGTAGRDAVRPSRRRTLAAARPAAAPRPGPDRPGEGCGTRPLRLRAALAAAPGARRSLVGAAGLGALAGLCGLALTTTSVWLIVRAAQHPNVQALAVAVVGVRTFALAKALLRYAERLAAHDGALRVLADVRARVFEALEPLAPAGLADFRRGDLLRRFTNDVDGAQDALVRAGVPMVGATVTVLGAVALAALVDAGAAAVLGAGVLAGVGVVAATARAGRHASASAAAGGRRAGLVTGLVDGLEELDAYGAVGLRLEEVRFAELEAGAAARRARRASAAGVGAAGLVSAGATAGVLAAGCHAVATGAVPVVLLGVLVAATLVAFDSLGALPPAMAALGRCLAGLRRVDAVLAAPVPLPEPAGLTDRPAGDRLGLLAESLTLRPAAAAPVVTRRADLIVDPGERIAVVGPSGSGKTTVLAALLRLLPLEEGQVSLTGTTGAVPIADLGAKGYAPLVSGSLQGDHVFATTLRDNLRVVAPDADDRALDTVALRVGLHTWVHSLPAGWSTQAGSDGANLSGGQRQRLVLARALLADPLILVLDEPTAHLDADTEAAVVADLVRSTAGRTLVMSTHRPALLDAFDHVVRLDGERLVEHRPPGARRRRAVPAAASCVGGTALRGSPDRRSASPARARRSGDRSPGRG